MLVDGGGFVLGALALGSLIFAGISGEQHGYGSWWIIALFVLAGLAGVAFVLVEQRPRQQSRPQVVPLTQGQGVIFAVRERPAEGARGVRRRALRHGVSTVRSGRRRTLGVIFHDAT